MSEEFSFRCPLPNGLHARPASHLADVAKQFSSDCTLTNLRNGSAADMKSVLSLIAADVRLHDECKVQIRGADQQNARAALLQFIEFKLAGFDSVLADASAQQKKELPRVLRAANVSAYPGLAVSRGIGQGKVVALRAVSLNPAVTAASSADPAHEQEQVKRAVNTLRVRMTEKLSGPLGTAESAILQAHLAMLGDAAFMDKILEKIAAGRSAAQAVADAGTFFADLLRRSENLYMRERALDIQGMCLELLETISPSKVSAANELTENSIVVAENLLPQQLLVMDRTRLRGLVLESAGTASHTVLLARSFGIPTLASVNLRTTRENDEKRDRLANNSEPQIANGTPAILDANRGFLILDPSPEIQKFYEHETQIEEERAAALARRAARRVATTDGHAIEVAANVCSGEEALAAFQAGADGIGVFRTEMLFMSREHPPGEEEQFQIYAGAARAAQGKPVILRTIDIGGDKPLPFLKMPSEENPFLGYRGVRIYPQHEELLQTQLRAMLRASTYGRIQIMVPMVSRSEEVLWFKTQLARAKEELRARNISFAEDVPLGIMVEVPSVAFMLDGLCRDVDFFSLGTNDLSQYFFAADRGNQNVAGLSSVTHPAFLEFLQHIVSAVRSRGKWIGICGDMAADVRNIPLLLGLELDELSIPTTAIPTIKERIAGLSLADCRNVLRQAVACSSSAEVESLLERVSTQAARGLLDRQLVLLRDTIESREEVIREIVDALYIDGRTDDPDRLEEALWAREAAYSTSMVPGFAVPHCKSDAVSAPSLAVLKLQKPVSWGPGNADPVQMVILLAARESDSSNAHLQTFSRLARNLMDDEFRKRLLNAEDKDTLLAALNSLTQK